MKYKEYHCEECGCKTPHLQVFDTDDETHENPIYVCETCGEEV